MALSPLYTSQQTVAGKTFHGTTTYAGVTIPIYSSTSPTFALWNPAGSNKMLVPVKLSLGVTATATPAIASLGLGQTINTGSALGTGNPITAFTDATIYNGRVGRTGGNLGRFALTATLTAASNFFYELGFSQATTSLAAGLVSMQHVFDGSIVMEPGTLIHLVGAPAAPVETCAVTISWTEIDLVP
jgi:hypothetical protein